MPVIGNGVNVIATQMLEDLTAGVPLDLPVIDFSDPSMTLPDMSDIIAGITPITTASLTEQVIGGNGVFDVLMTSVGAHLKDEYEKGRIMGGEYTKAYIAAMQASLGAAVQFLLGRDAATVQAVSAQVAAVSAQVNLHTAKMMTAKAQFEAHTSKAAYGLTAAKLATEDAQYGTLNYQLEHLLPLQTTLVREQGEAQRAQTLDTRSDTQPVTGLLGKQKALYSQQVTAYVRDSEYKLGKMFADSWLGAYVVNEGIGSPTALSTANISEVLTKLRENNNLTP
jgi:hypothetical protein